MSENTTSNEQEPVDVCFGMFECDEKSNVKMPPNYAYKISFNEKDCMVIPLEGEKTKKPKSQSKSKPKTDTKTEGTGRDD